jgi:hypothetical protein
MGGVALRELMRRPIIPDNDNVIVNSNSCCISRQEATERSAPKEQETTGQGTFGPSSANFTPVECERAGLYSNKIIGLLVSCQ